jgi:putative ABC transport system permease protein
MINIRERKYEIGVLRAIGMSKTKLTLQLISEIFIVSMAALIIGTSIGIISSQKVTNFMLQNEINELKEQRQNIRNNFGGGNFERPSMSGNRPNPIMELANNSTNYLTDFKVSVDFMTIILLIVVSLALTMTTGFISSVFINKYEPNKILQNRI